MLSSLKVRNFVLFVCYRDLATGSRTWKTDDDYINTLSKKSYKFGIHSLPHSELCQFLKSLH